MIHPNLIYVMKRLLALSAIAVLLLLLSNSSLYAQQRTKERVLSIANEQLIHKNAVLVHEARNLSVFNNRDKKGFVIVSDKEQLPEVLGYSDNGYFDPNNIPPNMKFWMESMQIACDAVLSGKAKVEDVFVTSASANNDVKPLLGDIEWSQEAPYNYDCPVVDGVQCPTGCAATALAMIMKYYEYPKQGIGSYSYTSTTNNLTLSYNYEDHPFDWGSMQSRYSALTVPDKKETVAKGFASKLIYYGFKPYESSGGIFISVDSLTCTLPSIRSFKGEMQFLLYDTDGNFLESVGKPVSFDDFSGQSWYTKPGYPAMASMPSSYPDGDYLLYIAYREDDNTEWKRLQQAKFNGNERVYVETKPAVLTKVGNNVYYGGLKGVCQYTLEETKAVSDLMFACGVAMDMDYCATESGAEIVHKIFPCVRNVFGYDRDMYLLLQSDAAQQSRLIIEQIENNAPVYIAGATESGYGHAFIADGLRYTQKGTPSFHINWGWSGMNNGYFLLTNLNPYGTGASDKENNFSHNIYAICGLKPEDGIDEAPSISFDTMSLSKSSVNTKEQITISATSIVNVSTYGFEAVVNVFLVGEDGKEYNLGEFFSTKGLWPSIGVYNQKSKAVTIPETVPSGTYNVEIRASISGGTLNFGRSIGVSKNLTVTGSTGIISIEDDATGNDSKVYDLYGRPVQKMSEGRYYIKDSKIIKN